MNATNSNGNPIYSEGYQSAVESVVDAAFQPAHQATHQWQFFVQFLGRIPVVSVQGDPPQVVEDQVRAAMHGLPTGGVKAFEPEAEIPDQKTLLVLHDAFGDDEMRFIQRFEHVGKYMLNGILALHLVERVFEPRIQCVKF